MTPEAKEIKRLVEAVTELTDAIKQFAIMYQDSMQHKEPDRSKRLKMHFTDVYDSTFQQFLVMLAQKSFGDLRNYQNAWTHEDKIFVFNARKGATYDLTAFQTALQLAKSDHHIAPLLAAHGISFHFRET